MLDYQEEMAARRNAHRRAAIAAARHRRLVLPAGMLLSAISAVSLPSATLPLLCGTVGLAVERRHTEAALTQRAGGEHLLRLPCTSRTACCGLAKLLVTAYL